jgi:uncharacterized damage-inducible protein DinB
MTDCKTAAFKRILFLFNHFPMTTHRSARMLTRYTAWANELTFNAVAQLPPGEATKQRPSLFQNIVHTLNHNYVINLIFQAHLLGREHGFAARNTPSSPSFQELWHAQREVNNWYIAWADGLTDAALEETIRFTFVGGGEGAMTRADILFHLINHTTYHHGFIADIFYQIPAEPPTTDLPVFLRDVPLYLGD